jgi:hypothetical protein
VPRAVAGPREGAGERLVHTFVTIWDSPAGAAGVALLRSAVTNQVAARLMREFLTTQVLGRVMTVLGVDPAEAATRSSLVASQLAGLAFVRYVLKVEPMAGMPVGTVVRHVGPTVQRYLTGDLAGPPADPAG